MPFDDLMVEMSKVFTTGLYNHIHRTDSAVSLLNVLITFKVIHKPELLLTGCAVFFFPCRLAAGVSLQL